MANFKSALVYPFQQANWLNCIVFPGAMTWLTVFFTVVVAIAAYLMLATSGIGDDNLSDAAESIQSIIMMPWNIAVFCITAGFQWYCYEAWQNDGETAESPSWKLLWKSFLGKGFLVWLFYLLISVCIGIVVAIGVIVLVIGGASMHFAGADALMIALITVATLGCVVISIAITPFLMAPLAHSAETKRFQDLVNLEAAVKLACNRYWQVMWALLQGAGIMVCYAFASIALCVTVVGILLLPVLWGGPLQVSLWHLLAQGFGLMQPETENYGL